MKRRHFLLTPALGALALGAAALAHAAYPERPITLVIPFSAGGPTDVVGRIVASKASEILGQQIVVDNRVGAAGTIGMTAVARARPDGYMLGLATVSTHGTAPHLLARPPYDPVKDFTPVRNLVSSPNILSVHPGFPAHNLKEFVAYVKAHPGKESYANAGAGGINDLGMAWFLQLSEASMISVPYKGSAPALNDAIGGNVKVIFDNFPSSLPFIKAGKLRALAITGTQRNDKLPEVPTFAEQGFKDYDVSAWYGVVAPARLPAEVRARLADAFQAALDDPATRQRLVDAGAFPVASGPDAFARQIRQEYERWGSVIRKAGIAPQ
ncbi:ABC transporter substrate-binding protein [Cupriavidus sp. USMAHM13]|uniref:Bug family tripartite tricarboxylate transporter substrate binding protein n=1 Tax=Cupriavidus sp. USMAHM13 TaxID=1389192 RepID=UPI0008A7158C|nr:tripartite tricarboxylate transporter substrate binding protein BugE [Cupriavidus sp. USMAHM13]AOZ03633.1 ABC transporter substrate-binding protein [Cupriavidus sp. USMAHM13]